MMEVEYAAAHLLRWAVTFRQVEEQVCGEVRSAPGNTTDTESHPANCYGIG